MTAEDNNNETPATTVETSATSGQATAAAAPVSAKPVVGTKPASLAAVLASIHGTSTRSDLPDFKSGDTVKVHARIVEGSKERIQVFEGVVIKRTKGNHPDATFTVRKISYNVGVERTFPVHSPRIDKLEIVTRAKVRRARLFYLRPLRGKAARMKTLYQSGGNKAAANPEQA